MKKAPTLGASSSQLIVDDSLSNKSTIFMVGSTQAWTPYHVDTAAVLTGSVTSGAIKAKTKAGLSGHEIHLSCALGLARCQKHRAGPFCYSPRLAVPT
jgi:hypothetical protein